MKSAMFFVGLALLVIGCGQKSDETSTANSSSPNTAAAAPTFASLQTTWDKCTNCHGENGKAGLDLRTHEAAMKSGAIKEGDAAGSALVQALRGQNGKKQMPMMAAPLGEDEIKKVEEWIAAGAKS